MRSILRLSDNHCIDNGIIKKYAIYLQNKNITLKDDPLSSLDNEVSKWIFENSIKNMLLKHQRTVILVTQKTNLVHHSDYVNILLVERFFFSFSLSLFLEMAHTKWLRIIGASCERNVDLFAISSAFLFILFFSFAFCLSFAITFYHSMYFQFRHFFCISAWRFTYFCDFFFILSKTAIDLNSKYF